MLRPRRAPGTEVLPGARLHAHRLGPGPLPQAETAESMGGVDARNSEASIGLRCRALLLDYLQTNKFNREVSLFRITAREVGTRK